MTSKEKLADIERRDAHNEAFSRIDTRWLIEEAKRLHQAVDDAKFLIQTSKDVIEHSKELLEKRARAFERFFDATEYR